MLEEDFFSMNVFFDVTEVLERIKKNHILPVDKLIKIDLVSDVGLKRLNNEDMILLGGELLRDASLKQTYELSDKVRFAAIVADGMGGHNCGEVASEMALRSFDDFVLDLPGDMCASDLVAAIKQWTVNVHHQMLRQAVIQEDCANMGTTLCGILFYEKEILIVNIGDSRVYRMRGEVLKQITTDHSVNKLMQKDDAQSSNLIYNSLGAGSNAFVDIQNLSTRIYKDDLFLICSDGLTDMLTDDEIEQVLTINPSAQLLVDKAKEAGGKDNISVVLLTINELENE